MFDRCPETEGEWLSQANAKNIGSLHGHEEFSSASKLPVDQFLALKAIWKFYDINHLANKDWAPRLGTNHAAIQEMRGELKKETAWRLYLDAVPKVLQPNQVFENHLGRFAMVLQNQKIVTKLDDAKHDQLKVVGSPITTRSGLRVQPPVHSTSMLQWQLAKTDDPQPRQPSPARPQSRAGSKAASEYSKAASDVTEGSWFDETLSKAERAKTADEQVVNTAAISFLQSLFVGDTRTAYWTPQRKGFRFGQTDFKAITDGHLQVVGQVRSAAILEVKARKRPDITQKKFEIERQESAQMALWIRDEPSSFWTTPDAPTKCRRILISQDHSQIYITIAEYEDSYLHYLQNKTAMGDAGFLTMNRFGPFITDVASHMDLFAAILKILIPYAATYPPQQKSPSPSPSPPAAERSASGERGRSPHTPPRLPALTTGRDGSPLAQVASRLGGLDIQGHSSPSSTSSESPSRRAQQASHISGGQTSQHSADQPRSQSSNPVTGPLAGQQSSHSLDSGRGRGQVQGRGAVRGRGQGRGQP